MGRRNWGNTITWHDGPVYYDRSVKRFFQVRKVRAKTLFCGDYTEYYSDAQTTILTRIHPKNILTRCVKVRDCGAPSRYWWRDEIGVRVRDGIEEKIECVSKRFSKVISEAMDCSHYRRRISLDEVLIAASVVTGLVAMLIGGL